MFDFGIDPLLYADVLAEAAEDGNIEVEISSAGSVSVITSAVPSPN